MGFFAPGSDRTGKGAWTKAEMRFVDPYIEGGQHVLGQRNEASHPWTQLGGETGVHRHLTSSNPFSHFFSLQPGSIVELLIGSSCSGRMPVRRIISEPLFAEELMQQHVTVGYFCDAGITTS